MSRPLDPDLRREAIRKWNHSEKGRAALKRYRQSAKGKAMLARSSRGGNAYASRIMREIGNNPAGN